MTREGGGGESVRKGSGALCRLGVFGHRGRVAGTKILVSVSSMSIV